jgi:hypothetical protein
LSKEPELVKEQTAVPTLTQKLGVLQHLLIVVEHAAKPGHLEEPVQLLFILQTVLAVQVPIHKLVKKLYL